MLTKMWVGYQSSNVRYGVVMAVGKVTDLHDAMCSGFVVVL